MKANAVYYRSNVIPYRRPYARKYPSGAGARYILDRIVTAALATVSGIGAVTALLFLVTVL